MPLYNQSVIFRPYDKENKFIHLFMDFAYQVAKLSYCKRKQVGAVITDASFQQVLSYGYNGTPSGHPNICEENNVTKDEVLHAEANALMKMARKGYATEGNYLFLTMQPCIHCAKMILQAGISRVFYHEEYRCNAGVNLLKQDIDVVKVDLYDKYLDSKSNKEQ